MKKRLAIFFILLVFLSGLGNFAVAAAAYNDLLNGDGTFENGQTNWQTGSSKVDDSTIPWWNTYCSIQTGTEDSNAVRTGTKGLKITADNSTTKPWVMRICSQLQAGATYQVEGYIKGDFTSAGFKTETYGDSGSTAGKETKYPGSTNNQWVKLSHTFTVPEGANKAKVYCRLYSAGTVYFDDVKLYMTEAPEPFSYDTSHVFHYADDTAGTASVHINSAYAVSDFENAEVSFAIKEKETSTVIKEQTFSFSGKTITFSYDPTQLALRVPGENDMPAYTLSVEIRDKESREMLDSYSQSLYRYNRPSMLGQDGFVRVDGEIIDPVIAYHVTNTADYAYMDDIGVNVVQVPYWYTSPGEATKREALLQALEQNGLKALFCLYRNGKMPNHPDNYNYTEYVIDQLKNDKRVFAFALMDEPLGAGVTDEKLSDLEESYKMIRDIDSMHPIYIVDYTASNFSYDLKYCDVFAVDPYNYSLTGVVNATREAVQIADGQKPVYTIVGAFKTSTGAFPSPDLVRHMTYQALVYGAKGFGYFCFEDCISKNVSDTGENIPLYATNLWEPMCEYARTDMQLAFENLVHRDGSVTITGSIAEKSWTENGETYFFIMSMSDVTETQTYQTTAARLEIVYGTENENITLTKEEPQGRYFQVNVPSGAVMLLRETYLGISAGEGNTIEIFYAAGTADLYAGIYDASGQVLKELYMAQNTNEPLLVTVPQETGICVKVFVFSPNSIIPLMRKTIL